ncbi:MAG: bifunctional nuclease domain-containing protein, partial [Candidatus Omnitrophota bacterium]
DLEATVEKVVIDRLEENTFHAKLFIKTSNGQVKSIDSRPSDSIALAVRAHAPIFVEDEIINKSEMFNNNK